jgi:hypothetical protein
MSLLKLWDHSENVNQQNSDSQVFLEVLLKGTVWPGNGFQAGEVLSPFAGEMRLQSDFEMSQDPRTACFWQAMISTFFM